jgi:hypothetical protein
MAVWPSVSPAQQGVREVRGRVMRAGPAEPRPLPGVWVTLHRVTTVHSGALDSVRTDAAGRYAFRYTAVAADSAAIFFASSTYAGIAYLTDRLEGRVVAGDAAELMVFDTTSAPVPIHLRGRHVIVTAPDSTGTRLVMEVFELSNDTTVTLVPGAANRATFQAPLPDGATDARAGDGDISPRSVTFGDGQARVSAPIAPGIKQFSFSYRLPGKQRSLHIAVPAATPVLEVLIEDAAGSAVGGRLRSVPPTAMEGRSFKRFLAQDVAANSPIVIDAPTRGGPVVGIRTAIIMVAVGALLLLMLSRGFVRRSPLLGAPQRATADADALARQIAMLDAAFEALPSPREKDRADHYEKRARLKARLTAALAVRDGLM